MKHWRSGLTLALGLISIAPLLHAAFSSTYTASPTVAVPTGCFPGPGDLQSCLTLAADDPQANMVVLQPGTYSAGPYTYAPVIDDDGGPGALVIQNETATLPILDGGNSVSCLNISNTALPSDLGADVTVSGLVFQNCFATSDGGALDIDTDLANIILENSDFFDNETTDDDGGAVALGSGQGTITVRDSTFERNQSTFEDGGGLDIFSDGGAVALTNSVFNQNISENDGGGANIETNSGSITLQGNIFEGNDGGILGNGDGGGARVVSSLNNILISNNLFSGNDSGSDGGGLYVFTGFDAPGTITIVNNILVGNSNGNFSTSTDTAGGGLAISQIGTDLTLTNNTIFGNTSQASDNVAIGGGLALGLDAGNIANVYNNIIFGNTAATDGGDIFSNENTFDAGGGTLNLFNNDFTSFFSEALDNGDAGTVNQGNNIDMDPLFVDSAAGNFNLTALSPAIDAGDPSAPGMPPTDFAGNPRPAIPGTDPDMGAFEFQPQPSPSPTPTPVPPPFPFLLQGDGCSLQVGAVPFSAWTAWAWLLAVGMAAYLRKSK